MKQVILLIVVALLFSGAGFAAGLYGAWRGLSTFDRLETEIACSPVIRKLPGLAEDMRGSFSRYVNALLEERKLEIPKGQ